MCPHPWLVFNICPPVIPCKSLVLFLLSQSSLSNLSSSFSLARVLLVSMVGESISSSSVIIFCRLEGTSHLRNSINAWTYRGVFWSIANPCIPALFMSQWHVYNSHIHPLHMCIVIVCNELGIILLIKLKCKMVKMRGDIKYSLLLSFIHDWEQSHRKIQRMQ